MTYRKQYFVWLVTTIAITAFAVWLGEATAEEVYPVKDWVKGGVYLGRSVQGNCVTKPFIKVGEAEDNPDDGKPQILGYEPGNVHVDNQGRAVWERVYEERFAPLSRPFKVAPCKCPPYRE